MKKSFATKSVYTTHMAFFFFLSLMPANKNEYIAIVVVF